MTSRRSIERRLADLEEHRFGDLDAEELRARAQAAYLNHLRATHDNRPGDAEQAWEQHQALLRESYRRRAVRLLRGEEERHDR